VTNVGGELNDRAGEFSPYIDPTTFAVVCSTLNRRSPIRIVLLVYPPCTLEEVAVVITAESGAEANLERLFRSGAVRLLLPADDRPTDGTSTWTLPMEQIPPNTPCHVLYLPPAYLLTIDEPDV
jgi:hypothetical protein